MNRFFGISIALLLAIVNLSAQDNDFDEFRKQALREFDDFKTTKTKEFNDFRDKANAEFAEFMQQAWPKFQAKEPIPIPPSPDPVKPPVVDPQKPPTADPIPFEEVKPAPQPVIPPQPVAPIPQPVEPVKQKLTFLFYQTECKVSLEPDQKIVLTNLSEEKIAKAWTQFSQPEYNALINDCLELRTRLNLCDWGYIQLIQRLSEKHYNSTTSNAAVVLQMYLLTQSGYKLRIAKSGERLALLVPSEQIMYAYTYFNLSGEKYYVIDKSLKGALFNIFDRAFPNEQTLSLQTKQPYLKQTDTPVKTYTSIRYPEMKVSVSTNQNLIDFYNACPVHSAWELYAAASMSEHLKSELYPALKKYIAGKSETEAANQLINFVQTAFEYQTDEEQFGYERPLFADETFYYPASDCEDRAILYSILVRELLGLDVVLLHYPNHLATAVHFRDDAVSGDYLMISGKKFIVCDPTYIGATIGQAMLQFKNVSAGVVRLP